LELPYFCALMVYLTLLVISLGTQSIIRILLALELIPDQSAAYSPNATSNKGASARMTHSSADYSAGTSPQDAAGDSALCRGGKLLSERDRRHNLCQDQNCQ
jgi:hypothetical protein